MQFVKPTPFAEAVDKLGAKSIIGSQLSSSEWSDVPAALRERAFFSSRVESARVLQRGRDAIGDFLQANRETLPSGQTALTTGSRSAFVDQMQKFLDTEGIARGAGGLTDLTSEKRLGLIFDVQTQQAGDYGYWRQGMDPDVLDEFPAQRFIRVKDVKEPRDSHIRFEDQVYLKTDPIWANEINEDFGVPWGPWGWGCGHDVEDVDREEAEQLGLLQPGEEVKPDIKNFNENLEASTRGLDPDLIDKLRAAFGNQIRIVGQSMRWTGDTRTPAAPPAKAPVAPQLPAAPAAPAKPAVAPVAPAAPVAPVSQALDVKMRGTTAALVKQGLAAIDAVHDDGTLPTIPLTSKVSQGSLGVYRRNFGGRAAGIGVKTRGKWPALSTVHEVGHFLDNEAISNRQGDFASRSGHPEMLKVLAAADQTQAVKLLRQGLAAANTTLDRAEYNYYLTPHEIWARAYAQFIAEQSQDPQLLADVAKVIAHKAGRQWETADFAPLKAAIENLFKSKGWM